MNTRKQILIMLCLLCGLSQVPVAQAQGIDPLAAMASKLLPLAIPVAATVVTAAVPVVARMSLFSARAAALTVRAVPMIPAYAKEKINIKVPMPHFRRGTEIATSVKDNTNSDGQEGLAAKANVSASITNGENDAAAVDGSAPSTVDGATSSSKTEGELEREQMSQMADVPIVRHRAKSDGNGGWVRDDQ